MSKATTAFSCPCGSTMYFKAQRVSGWWNTTHDANGSIEETNLDGLRFGAEPKTVICSDCKKRRRNPAYTEEQEIMDEVRATARKRVARMLPPAKA